MDPSTNSAPTPNQTNQNPAAPAYNGSVQPTGLPRSESDRLAPASVTIDGIKAPTVPAPQALPSSQPTLAPPVPIGDTMPLPPAKPGLGRTSQTKTDGTGKPKPHPNSTQNSLQIAEIRDGIVIMNDGSFRAVVMAKSINFDLMSPQEQEAVEYSYQSFLNSLYFPIQISIRSQKVDLGPYIEKLNKIRTEHDNMLLALLMEDYIGYIGGLSEQTNIMDKRFYIVIPFFPVMDSQKALDQSKNFLTGLGGLFKAKDQHITVNEADLENAKTELRNRVQAVLSGLQQCGIQGLPLDTQEMIELYYDTYNPDTATRQKLQDFNSLTADVVTKGQGNAPQAHLQRELE